MESRLTRGGEIDSRFYSSSMVRDQVGIVMPRKGIKRGVFNKFYTETKICITY